MKRSLSAFVTFAALISAGMGVCAPIRSPAQDGLEVLKFWTPENMKLAERARGGPANPVNEVLTEGGDHYGFVTVPPPHTEELSRRAGVLFYVSPDGALQHCSATALSSPKGNLVLTAAHCVIEYACKWKSKALFVPGYDGTAPASQRTPFGSWPVHYMYIPTADAYSSADADLAIVSVFPQKGTPLQSRLGGASRPYVSREQERLPDGRIWSYPGVTYSGGEMKGCVSRLEPMENASGITTPNCETMSGSSGTGFRFNKAGSDWVAGVVHETGYASRLRPSTFNDLYELASGGNEQAAECSAP